MTLEQEIREAINKHTRENVSNTPDFILAEFMMRCLEAFESTTREREKWYGAELKPFGSVVTKVEEERPAFLRKIMD